jgi:hypothetical protein
LKNKLTKLELTLRKKGELAENLQAIDFEQLRLENQTLNEKIEERADDIHKLRKKIVGYIQLITHFREKVCGVRFLEKIACLGSILSTSCSCSQERTKSGRSTLDLTKRYFGKNKERKRWVSNRL